MTTARHSPAAKASLLIFALLFATTVTQAWLYRRLWVLAIPALFLIWIAALLIAAVKSTDVLRGDLSPPSKVLGLSMILMAIALPFAILSSGLGRQVEASIFLMVHRGATEQAERIAGSGRPAKIDFLQGIPDGGQAIIRWDRKPTELSQAAQVSLTGERIKRCRRIVPDAWLCDYD